MSREVELPRPTDATSAVLFHPTNPDLLLTSSWSSTTAVSLFNLSSSFPTPPTPAAVFAHPSPVLDVAFGAGVCDGKAYSGGLDHGVRELDLETGVSGNPSSQRVLTTHTNAARCLHFSPSHSLLLSGSWDKSLLALDPRSPSSALNVPNLPGKVFAMDARGEKVVVAMAGRKVWIWDVRQLKEAVVGKKGEPPAPWQERESSLKFMTRAVECMPNEQGYASTSIEGRVAVEFFDPVPSVQAKKYAFKCHRQLVEGTDTVYPVNALAFHPVHGTFATGGGDAVVSIWDPSAKKRLRQLPRFPSSVSSLAFNSDGTRLAVACSVVEEEGTAKAAEGGAEPRNAVVVRSGSLDDYKPKAK